MMNHPSTTLSKYKERSLLVITPEYPDKSNQYSGGIFVKDQLAVLKDYFKEIIVIAPILFSFKILSNDRLCTDYCYDNVHVYFPRSIYIPWPVYRKVRFPRILVDTRLSAVQKMIKKENLHFDLIHAHFTWPSAYIGVKLKEHYRTPVITTIHENTLWLNEEIQVHYSELEKAWTDADTLIRVSSPDVPLLQKYNKQVVCIPNGYAPRFKPLNPEKCRSALNLKPEIKVLFALGSLIERKGYRYLIDAMNIVSENRTDVVCFIGGSGPLYAELNNQIRDSHLEDHVKVLGLVSDENLPLWMNACDLFVHPSLSESFGIVQIEAMACGKPVVATRNGGSEEVVTSTEYGLLVEPADPNDLAEKILMALDQEWSREAILAYAKRYTWKNVVGDIIRVYKQILF